MLRIKLVERNKKYNQNIMYKFDIDEDNPLYNEWVDISDIHSLNDDCRVWHCGEILTLFKNDITSLLIENIN